MAELATERLPPERRPVADRRRRRGGRVRRRRHAVAARGAPRHPAHPQHQRGRRGADAARRRPSRWSGSPSARRARCRSQVTAVGEAGHASVPTLGNNAVPLLARLIPRLGDGMPEPPVATPIVTAMLAALLGRDEPDLRRAVAEAEALHPSLAGSITALMGSTLAPTMLSASNKRNVMPARASVEVDCRILPGTTQADVEARCGRCSVTTSPTSWTGPRRSSRRRAHRSAARARRDRGLPRRRRRPGHGAADDVHRVHRQQLPACRRRHRGVRLQPLPRHPVEVLDAGYHNADERVHVDDLLLSTRFHVDLARRILG